MQLRFCRDQVNNRIKSWGWLEGSRLYKFQTFNPPPPGMKPAKKGYMEWKCSYEPNFLFCHLILESRAFPRTVFVFGSILFGYIILIVSTEFPSAQTILRNIRGLTSSLFAQGAIKKVIIHRNGRAVVIIIQPFFFSHSFQVRVGKIVRTRCWFHYRFSSCRFPFCRYFISFFLTLSFLFQVRNKKLHSKTTTAKGGL